MTNRRPVVLFVGGYGRTDNSLDLATVEHANQLAYELGFALLDRDIDAAIGGRFEMAVHFIAGARNCLAGELSDRLTTYFAAEFAPTYRDAGASIPIDDDDTFWFQILRNVDAVIAISGRENTFNALHFAKQMDIPIYPLGTIEGTAKDIQQQRRLVDPDLQFLGDDRLTPKQMAEKIAASLQKRFQDAPAPSSSRRARATKGAPGVRIGLALSGGGFRATLFHLGVVRFLFETKTLLPNVRHIGGVSGGSILAAHLVLHWERYGSAEGFETAAQELIAFVRRGIRNNIVRRWLFGLVSLIPRYALPRAQRWTLNNLLVSEYTTLFGDKRLADLAFAKRPSVSFYSASLTNGSACEFENSDFRWHIKQAAQEPIPVPATYVALAVAASSAFPPLFPPIKVSHNSLFVENYQFPNPQYLTDGGVYDNLGIEGLLRRQRRDNNFDLILISDAEGNFDQQPETAYIGPIRRNVRANDLLMTRVSHMLLRGIPAGVPISHIRIKGAVGEAALDKSLLFDEAQRMLCNTRTDLDAFSDDLVTALIAHGYSKARHHLIQDGIIPFDDAPPFSWHPLNNWDKVRQPDFATRLRREFKRKL